MRLECLLAFGACDGTVRGRSGCLAQDTDIPPADLPRCLSIGLPARHLHETRTLVGCGARQRGWKTQRLARIRARGKLTCRPCHLVPSPSYRLEAAIPLLLGYPPKRANNMAKLHIRLLRGPKLRPRAPTADQAEIVCPLLESG